MGLPRGVTRWALLLVGLPALALVLVVAADLVPNRYVTDRLVDAIDSGHIEARPYFVGSSGGQVDRFSECKRLTIGLGAPPGTGTLRSAVSSPTLGPCQTAVPKLQGWAAGEGLERAYDYFRYWNGSTVVLRPSVVSVGVDGTRVLAAAALAVAVVSWARQLRRVVGAAPPVLFLGAVVLTTDAIDLPSALVHAVGMVVTFAAAALLLWRAPPSASPTSFAAAAFAAGAASQFFGDLTNPDASWALFVASAAALCTVLPIRQAIGRVAATGVGWIVGFAWIWASKWAVAAVVLGYDRVRSEIVDKAEERLGGAADGYDDGSFAGLVGAWRVWNAQPLMPWAALVLAAVAAVIMFRRGNLTATWTHRVVLSCAAIIPPLWHLALRNHTTVHSFFTYRSYAVALGIVLIAATARISSPATPEGDAPQLRWGSAQVGVDCFGVDVVPGDGVGDD